MRTRTSSRILRRSSRRSIPTPRAQEFLNEHASFPSVGDDIIVKWVVNGRCVWWPATVTSLQEPRGNKCSGEVLYHRLEDYDAIQTKVMFSTSFEQQRFIRSVESESTSSDTNNCSWLFSDESVPESDKSSNESSSPCSSPSSSRAKRANGSRSTPLRSRGGQLGKRRSHQPELHSEALKRQDCKRSDSGASTVVKSQNNESTKQTEDKESAVVGNSATNKNVVPSAEDVDLRLRIQVIERQLQDVAPKSSSFSSPAVSVIVSLRWALLRYLEKPLRLTQLPEMNEHGLVSQEVAVSAQCDYETFREIGAVLAKEHKCAFDDPCKSRVAFSPAFQTMQSGSTASDNLNILFATLADLASFLGLRDDNDFEHVLSKEVVTDATCLLRVLGTVSVENVGDEDGKSHKYSTSTTNPPTTMSSQSANSSSVSKTNPVLRLFIGSCPLVYEPISPTENVTSTSNVDNNQMFRSTLFQQECRHFCPVQKCYRMPWTVKHINSRMMVNSFFHLDGTTEKEQLKKYFLLTWTQQPAPSPVKWTRDVHRSGINSPGYNLQSIPTIVFLSNRIVRSLVGILDEHIETFMTIRSMIHSLSSFK